MTSEPEQQRYRCSPFGQFGFLEITGVGLGLLFILSKAADWGAIWAWIVGLPMGLSWVVLSFVAIRDRFRPRWIVIDHTGMVVPGPIWGHYRMEFDAMAGTKLGFWRRSIQLRFGRKRLVLAPGAFATRSRFSEFCEVVADRVEIATGRKLD